MTGRKRAAVAATGSSDEAAPTVAMKRGAGGASKRRRAGAAKPAAGPILGSCASVAGAVDHSETESHAKFLKKCARYSGCDIRKDTSAARSRRARHMLVFPGRLRDVAGGRAGHLRDLDTAEPKLLLDAGTDKVLTLAGAHVKSSQRYAMLSMARRKRGPPQVACDSMFDTLVVFHKAEFMRVEPPGSEEGAEPTLRPCSPPAPSAPERVSGRRSSDGALLMSQESARSAVVETEEETEEEMPSPGAAPRRQPRRARSAVKSYREAGAEGGEDGDEDKDEDVVEVGSGGSDDESAEL